MRMICRALVLLVLLVLLVTPAAAQCPSVGLHPGFTQGGNVFGRIAAQWNQYFAAKADANNGTLCNATIIGGFRWNRAVKTADYDVQTADVYTHFLNTGAAGAVNLFLPPATTNMEEYCVTVATAQTVAFVAQSGERIAHGLVNSVTGGYVSSASPYSTLCVRAVGVGQWVSYSFVGTWAVQVS